MAKSKLKAVLAREQNRVKEAALRAKAVKNKKELQENKKAKATGNKKRKVEGEDIETDNADVISRPKRFWIPFNRSDKVLLVGEGDFSFTYSILKQNLIKSATATVLDSEEEVMKKYPSSISTHLEYLKENDDCLVLFQVDGTKLEKSKSLKQHIGTYDTIIFNFPHLGNSIKDQDRNILQHQKLIMAFFNSSKCMINPNGKVLITIFDGEPYYSWNIKQLARANGFSLLRSGKFEWEAFPEYSHHLTSKEGHTSKPQKSRSAKMYLFELYKEKDKSKDRSNDKSKDKSKSKKRKIEDESDSD